MKTLTQISLLGGLLVASMVQAAPNENPTWQVNGSNIARFDYHNVNGDRDNAPFPFVGPQFFDSFDVNFSKEKSPFETVRGITAILLNSSEYRSNEQGLLLERFNLTWEKGDAKVPFKGELGDVFAFYSFRTLQRSLKGAQLELQPTPGTVFRDHSLLMTAGVNKPVYRDFGVNDDRFLAASYLTKLPVVQTIGANYVHSHRDGRSDNGIDEDNRSQRVTSVMAEQKFNLGAQRLTFEEEVGHFDGDHTFGVADNERNQEEMGYFIEMNGRSSKNPLTYQFIFEDYGKDYLPAGGVVTANRQTIQGSMGWLFGSGINLRGRLQHFKDNQDDANVLDTNVAGISLSGPVKFVSVGYNGFVRDAKSDDRDINQLDITNDLNLGAPLGGGWNGRLGLFHQKLNDQRPNSFITITRQVSLSADHSLSLGKFQGNVSPGILWRHVTGGLAQTRDLGPSIAMTLASGPHSIGADYRRFGFERSPEADVTDLTENNFAMAYNYTVGRHRVGFEAEVFDRKPRNGIDESDTFSYHTGLSYTYSFDNQNRSSSGFDAVQGGGPVVTSPIALTQVTLGESLAKTESTLKEKGIEGGVRQAGGVVVYETRLLDNIDNRQRLALVTTGNAVTKTALVIDFDDTGNRDNVAQTFERVRKALVDRYGQPTLVVDEGDFAQTFVDDVNNDKLIRVTEWQLPEGTLRLGIPRRLDRVVRMEVQFAKRFPDPRQTRWSVEEVK